MMTSEAGLNSDTDSTCGSRMVNTMNPMQERKTYGLSIPKTNRKYRQQEYNKRYDQKKDIRKFITRDPNDDFRVICKLCDISLAAVSLQSHITSNTHELKALKMRKIKEVINNSSKRTKTNEVINNKSKRTKTNEVINDTSKRTKTNEVINNTSKRTKTNEVINNTSKRTKTNDVSMARKAELKLTAFLVEHAIASDAAGHLESLLKDCFPDSKICQEITVNEEKMKNTITEVIEPNMKSELASKLSKSKFSILADELTDTSGTRTFCLIVRYFDSTNGRIQSSFWKLHHVPHQTVTAINLYKEIMESFSEFNIPVENILGFGSDGCNDVLKTVASKFNTDDSRIGIVKFISHSAHLCANEACKSIPDKCEILACAVYMFLKANAKRSAQLVEFQTFLDLKPYQMLHPSQTRWLSLTTVVNFVLEQWPALTRFINERHPFELAIAGGTVVQALLRNDFIKLYYYFLQWILPRFDYLNAYFQSSKMIITELNAKIEEFYKGILLCFMENKYVMETKLQNIDPQASDKYLNDARMYLGVSVRTQISENPNIRDNPAELRNFYRRCRRFLTVVVMEIRERWDFGNPLMVAIAVLDPKVARSSREWLKTPSILPLLKTLPRILEEYDTNQQQRLEDQWRKLPLVNFPADISESNEPDVFWGKILSWKNSTDEEEFSVLARFALDALVFPHADAECERIFSNMNMIKTRMRNKVLSECQTTYQTAILSDRIKRNENGCVSFQPSTEMINSMTPTTLQGEPEPSASTSCGGAQ